MTCDAGLESTFTDIGEHHPCEHHPCEHHPCEHVLSTIGTNGCQPGTYCVFLCSCVQQFTKDDASLQQCTPPLFSPPKWRSCIGFVQTQERL